MGSDVADLGRSVGRGVSWFADDVLGIDPEPTPAPGQQNLQPAPPPGGAPTSGGSMVPEVAQPAPAAPGGSPVIQNIVSAPPPAAAPPPPTFGAGPSGGRPRQKSSRSTFLGNNRNPTTAPTGGFGFQEQKSGSKTLIGT